MSRFNVLPVMDDRFAFGCRKEGNEMTQDEMKVMMQKPEIQEMMAAFFESSGRQRHLEMRRHYRLRNRYAQKGQILFVGSSLMENFPVNEFQQTLEKRHVIYNRGIGGYVMQDLLESMDECIFELEPSKVFINIGTNDISRQEYRLEKLLADYKEILVRIRERLPDCQIHVMAYYPINATADFPGVDPDQKADMYRFRTNRNIQEANRAIEQLAGKLGLVFINVNHGLMDEQGDLKAEYAIEGLHLWPDAYAVILQNLKEYL